MKNILQKRGRILLIILSLIIGLLRIFPTAIKLFKLRRQKNNDILFVNSFANVTEFWEANHAWLDRFKLCVNFSTAHATWLYRSGPEEIYFSKLLPDEFCARLKELSITSIRMGIDPNLCPNNNIDYYRPWLKAFHKNQIEVFLVIGIKTPRWPEIHIPQETLEDIFVGEIPAQSSIINLESSLASYILDFQHNVYQQLFKDKYSIVGIQIENEPLKSFGDYGWLIADDLLRAELELSYQYFPNCKLMLNCSIEGQQISSTARILERFMRDNSGAHCELGLNQYFITPNLGKYFDTRMLMRAKLQQPWWQLFQPDDLEKIPFLLNHLDISISEFQFEPWRTGDHTHDQLKQPGNDWKFFAYSLIQSARLFGGKEYSIIEFPNKIYKNQFNGNKFNLYLWGIEEFLQSVENNQTKHISMLIKLINN